MAIPENRILGKKEADLFRSLVKCYEQKLYKKGVKNADVILKKHPNHGETQAMKGLILNCLEKKEEAYELVKLGLRNDMRSHVCWHVFGLLYRSDRNYNEAIKCYLNALKIDKDNQNILRDLSFLQVQMRNMSGFAESRRQLLVLKPGNRASWITYGVAAFFNGDFSAAHSIIETFLASSAEEKVPYEISELLLFQNECNLKRGAYAEGLAHLDVIAERVVDQLSWRTRRAELLTLNGSYNDALDTWKDLLAENPENYRYHCGLQIAALELPVELCLEMLKLKRLELPSTILQLSESQLDTLRREYAAHVPSSATSKIALDFLQGEEFLCQLDSFLQKGLRAGKPNLYNDIAALTRIPDPMNPSKRSVYAKDAVDLREHHVTKTVLKLLDRYLRNLAANGTFVDVPAAGAPTEVPTALMWALFLRSHLLSACGRHSEALRDIETAIEHTPTSLDCLYKRARILKNSGDYKGACDAMDYCRSLDLQDRYANNKATKYFMRADRVQQGMDTIALFTKHDGDPQQILHDLQCIWYELEMGQAYSRRGQWGLALKAFYTVHKHFTDFIEDQFDFHSFAIRKTTLRAYIDMIQSADVVLKHRFFQTAGQGALRVLLRRMDDDANPPPDTPADDDKVLTAADKKKEKNRLKKLKKKDDAVHGADDGTGAGEAKGGPKKSAKDDDPLGEKILAKNPLEEAVRWSVELTRQGCSDPSTHELVCEAMCRKGKHVFALRSLRAGLSLEPDHPGCTFQLLKFARSFYGLDASAQPWEMKPVVREIVGEKLEALLGGEGATAISGLAESFISRAEAGALSLPHRVAAARCVMLLSGGTQRATALLLDDSLWDQRGATVKNAAAALEALRAHVGPADGTVDAFVEKFREHFPLSNAICEEATPLFKGVVEGVVGDV